MKTRSTFFVLVTLLIGITFLSCKKSNSSPNGGGGAFVAKASFTIDGSNFIKQAVTINGMEKGNSYCYYWSKYKISELDIEDAPGIGSDFKNELIVIFNGNTPSTQKAGDDANGGPFSSVYFQVDVTAKDGVRYSGYFSNSASTPGTITVTKFGNVGGIVEGTFSGTLMDGNGNYNLHVTNGTFSITRGFDITN